MLAPLKLLQLLAANWKLSLAGIAVVTALSTALWANIRISTLENRLEASRLQKLEMEHALAAARLFMAETHQNATRIALENLALRERAEAPVLDDIGVRVVTRWLRANPPDCPVLPADAARVDAGIAAIPDASARAAAERLRAEIERLRGRITELNRDYAEAVAHDLALGARALRVAEACRAYGELMQANARRP
jgi:hypothetical protein